MISYTLNTIALEMMLFIIWDLTFAHLYLSWFMLCCSSFSGFAKEKNHHDPTSEKKCLDENIIVRQTQLIQGGDFKDQIERDVCVTGFSYLTWLYYVFLHFNMLILSIIHRLHVLLVWKNRKQIRRKKTSTCQ